MGIAWRTRFAGLFSARPTASRGIVLRLYTRADCPLCEELEATLGEVRWRRLGLDPGRVRVERRDVDACEPWRERYGLSVPVLEHVGRALAQGRATRDELERRLARRLAGQRAEGGDG